MEGDCIMGLRKKYECAYLSECFSGKKDEVCEVMRQAKAEMANNNHGYARAKISTCQMNHKYEINIKES